MGWPTELGDHPIAVPKCEVSGRLVIQRVTLDLELTIRVGRTTWRERCELRRVAEINKKHSCVISWRFKRSQDNTSFTRW